jgi:predicted Rossmann-fold nucleotide-binding protein
MKRLAISSVAAVAGGGNVGVMKFNAAVVLELTADDVAEAGERVNALLALARAAALEARSIELSTAPGVAVSLVPVASAR